MKFNEDSRVKIPAILHLMRLGYQYLSLKGQSWDIDTNIYSLIYLELLFVKLIPALKTPRQAGYLTM